jgi:LmbE family N-acetylglucosaminyl deacetylase
MHVRYSRALRVLVVALSLLSSYFTPHASSQRPPEQPDAAKILHEMQKLNVLGSVLYIVAHPDDENTRLIAWLANGKKVRTGNLSLTRGDGGQNLIGPELGDALGIIRTQELLEARRIDGGEQFFTRAVDFGYSKSAKESFEKWGHDEVLSDVVRVIRMFRPDIIITRFPPTREAGHGHHEASAILAAEAFDLAGDPKAFPEQLAEPLGYGQEPNGGGLHVWQPRRLFFNGSTWWKKNLAEIAKPDSGWYTVDVGGYDPLLGLSYTEIAGRSRSMHKSQGFGAAETRGEMIEYLKLVKGDKPKTSDIFEGIDMTWGREPKASEIQQMIQSMMEAFDPGSPQQSIQALFRMQRVFEEMPYRRHTHYWLAKQGANEALLAACAGIKAESISALPYASVSDTSVHVDMNMLSRSANGLRATSFWQSTGTDWVETPAFDTSITLSVNKPVTVNGELQCSWRIDEPYWLRSPHGNLHDIMYKGDVGDAVSFNSLNCGVGITSSVRETNTIDVEMPVLYKWVDRVAGERIRPVYVTPVASIIPEEQVLIARGGPQALKVEVEALTDSLTGQLNVTLPAGWATTKDLKLVKIPKRNERQSFIFQLIPMENAQGGAVTFEFTGPKGKADRTLHEIDYPHIMPQVYYTPAEVKLVPLDVKVNAKTVGYVKGAGDEVPAALEQLGVTVEMIDPATTKAEDLSRFDAIVTGIRAYNTVEAMKTLNAVLMQYVENGGTLVSQYNTKSSDMMLPDSLFGPYPFKLTRDRVTVEEGPPTFLAPEHPLLNTPNKITTADFDGWVQERGLYFCGSLDPHYTPLIAWNDPGEQPLNGGLITCDYGKGRYIYTGISFFRELPAGVPGAYRLFANLIGRRQ